MTTTPYFEDDMSKEHGSNNPSGPRAENPGIIPGKQLCGRHMGETTAVQEKNSLDKNNPGGYFHNDGNESGSICIIFSSKYKVQQRAGNHTAQNAPPGTLYCRRRHEVAAWHT